jgi:hypothetical protein
MKRANDISEAAAVELLRRIFDSAPGRDELSLGEIYVAVGRGELDADVNRNWLNTVMLKLKRHSFIAPQYEFDRRKKLRSIKLTVAGKAALGRTGVPAPQSAPPTDSVAAVGAATPDSRDISYNDVAKAVRLFRDNNPEFEVVFRVTLKEAPMQQQ